MVHLPFKVTTFSRYYHPRFSFHEETNSTFLRRIYKHGEDTTSEQENFWLLVLCFSPSQPTRWKSRPLSSPGRELTSLMLDSLSSGQMLALFPLNQWHTALQSEPSHHKPTFSTGPGRNQVLLILPSDLPDVLRCLFTSTAKSLERPLLPRTALVAQASPQKIRFPIRHKLN